MHKDQGAEGKKYLPSRNVLGVTGKKKKKTPQNNAGIQVVNFKR